jgi:transposase-like protein
MKKNKAKKKKGRKRKSKISEAAAQKARKRHWDHGTQHIPIHPDDLEPNEPLSFQHSCKPHTRWRCQECRYGFDEEQGIWWGPPNSKTNCPRCRSTRIQQQDAKYRCLNCDEEFWDFPTPTSCPNKRCPRIEGKKHPGDENDRGTYVVWIDYEEWARLHGFT